MVPKLHAKGSSFRGIAQYVLHDKDRAETSERVAWTAVRNLTSEDPHVAWKLMAATAMDADRLKADAGIKNTGRKSKDSVLHLTLSWHPDEGDGLDRDEMLKAAYGSIKALGALDRQALIVCHSDEEQPHVHVVINRVSPEDGRMLTSSKEKLNLSKWAQKYEMERGLVLCDQRVLNNAARDRGEYVRGDKDVPRHIYEHSAGNDNRRSPEHRRRLREQREKDKAIGRRQRKTKNRQAAEWAKLQGDHRARRRAILDRLPRDIEAAKQNVRAGYKDRWEALHHEQRAERQAFERGEATFLGRMKNRAKAIDLKAIVRGEEKSRALGEVFVALASAGLRLEMLKKLQAGREAALLAEQRKEEHQAATKVRTSTKQELARAGGKFQSERSALVLRQSMEEAKFRAEWRTRERQRVQASERSPSPTADAGGSRPSGVQTIKLDPALRELLDSHRQRARNAANREQQTKNRSRDEERER